MEPLRIEFDRAGPKVTVYVSGELDPSTAPAVAEQVISQVRDDTDYVEMDVSGITFCDSSGVRAFISMHDYMAERSGTFSLYGPTVMLRRVLAATAIDQLMPVRGGSARPVPVRRS